MTNKKSFIALIPYYPVLLSVHVCRAGYTEQFYGGVRRKEKWNSKDAGLPFLPRHVLQHRRMYNSIYVEFRNR